MGSIISAIHDDIEDYERRCKKYGEQIVKTPTVQGHMLPNCYGEHSQKLKEKEIKEWRAAHKKEKKGD